MKQLKIDKAILELSEVDKEKCCVDSPYSEIITTEVPIRWFWLKGGSLDGICIGSSEKGFSNFETSLLENICETLLCGN